MSPGLRLLSAALLAAGAAVAGPGPAAQEITLSGPEVLLEGISFRLQVDTAGIPEGSEAVIRAGDGTVLARGTLPAEGETIFPGLVVGSSAQIPITVQVGDEVRALSRPLLPGWITIVPSLVAIALALVFHEAVTSLFAGIWLGCLFIEGFNPFSALFSTVGRFVRDEASDPDHVSIIMFSLLLGGMAGVLSRMGALRAIVEKASPLTSNRMRGQLAAWAAGMLIFFDDYANCLIVGNTMRPLTDRLKISREKLAYIVDSTAAPVMAIVFVSTWVGAEIGYIKDGLDQAAPLAQGAPPVAAFGVFLASIPYLFYPLLAILMVPAIIVMDLDFGPMLAAERRAASGRGVSRPGADVAPASEELREAAPGSSPGWWTGALPVLIVVVTVLAGLIYTGLQSSPAGSSASHSSMFGGADPFMPLLWGSLLGCIVAVALAVTVARRPIRDVIGAWLGGIRSMLMAAVILVLAWSLGAVTQTLGTASFLASVLSDRLPIEALPISVFLVASVISFATGSSWGTMAILYPVVIPLAIAMGGSADALSPGWHFLLASTAGVMAGALFGDHCSPISDTTVLSSMASGCDHVDHVRTQLPYALTVAAIAGLAGALPSGFGISPWISLVAGAAVLLAVVRIAGRKAEASAG